MKLIDAERRLQDAQREGDVVALDVLLHPSVAAAGPDGTVFTKVEDLEAHRSGALRIVRLEEESLSVREDGATGMTELVATVEAVQHGSPVLARLRYTRLWVVEDGRWRVLAATFTPLPQTGARPGDSGIAR